MSSVSKLITLYIDYSFNSKYEEYYHGERIYKMSDNMLNQTKAYFGSVFKDFDRDFKSEIYDIKVGLAVFYLEGLSSDNFDNVHFIGNITNDTLDKDDYVQLIDYILDELNLIRKMKDNSVLENMRNKIKEINEMEDDEINARVNGLPWN